MVFCFASQAKGYLQEMREFTLRSAAPFGDVRADGTHGTTELARKTKQFIPRKQSANAIGLEDQLMCLSIHLDFEKLACGAPLTPDN